MNTNPQAKRILCYGDSNTWGFVPVSKARLPVNLRWPGLLQQRLGKNYEVIEEGLNSRTTNLDDPDRIGRNGKTYLIPCLLSQNPLDLVVLMLGTNDLKGKFQRNPQQVANGVRNLVETIREYALNKRRRAPKVILVSPPLVDEGVELAKVNYFGGEEKSKQLGKLYGVLAKKEKCEFLDAAIITQPSPKDGLHLGQADHQKLAETLYQKILSLKT